MSTVQQLATFLHLYLHVAGKNVSKDASMNELLVAAQLPTEQQLAIMAAKKPKRLQKLVKRIQELYEAYTMLNLEKKKAEIYPRNSKESSRATSAINILELRINNIKDKLKGYPTVTVNPPTRRILRAPSPVGENKNDSSRDEDPISSDDDPIHTVDDPEEMVISDSDSSSDDDDDRDDSNGESLDGAAVDGANDGLAEVDESGPSDVPEELGSVNGGDGDDNRPLEIAAVALEAEEEDTDALMDIGRQLEEVNDILVGIDLEQLRTPEVVDQLQDPDSKTTIDNKVNVAAKCDPAGKFFETITAYKNPKTNKTYKIVGPTNGKRLEEIGSSPLHYCKGLLAGLGDCDLVSGDKKIRVCKNVTDDSGALLTRDWGVHVICPKHYDDLCVMAAGNTADWQKVAKFLGSRAPKV